MNRLSDRIRNQYEQYPYPARRPEDELTRLLPTVGDNLHAISHYCFRGALRPDAGFRALVAGGGTGDAVIYLAEQLKQVNATVVYLDPSPAARRIAMDRARYRKLDNIEWHTADIGSLAHCPPERFDYINCSGVLHHLPDPDSALRTLAAQLKPDGAIYLMLYGRHGRTAVYPMQDLLRKICDRSAPLQEKVRTTRSVLANLPVTNWFRRDIEAWQRELDFDINGDTGLVDLLLHAQDRAYDVGELVALAGGADLQFVDFVGPDKRNYQLETHVTDAALLKRLSTLDPVARWEVAESLYGRISKHQFYLSKQPDTQARLGDLENSVVLSDALAGKHQQIARLIKPGEPLKIGYRVEGRMCEFELAGTRSLQLLFSLFDGNTTLHDAIDTCKRQLPGVAESRLVEEIRSVFELLHPVGCAYLRRP